MSTNTSRIYRSINLIAGSLICGQTLLAQNTGHLKGRVSDSEGSAIKTTLRNMRLRVTTDDAICILMITSPANKAKPSVKKNPSQ